MSASSFDIKDFRRTLGQFPTGVTVITTNDAAGNPVGVTASSFNTVSIEPALILWSIDKGANSLSTFENAEYFSVNVLAQDQVSTSNNFASRGEDKFANAQYHKGLGGVPLLDHYAAQFECKTWAVYEGGDHLILVGKVQEYRNNAEVEPLVFARGGYAIAAQHPETIVDQSSVNPIAVEDDFLGDFLLYQLRKAYQRFSDQLYPQLAQQCEVTPEEWRILARMLSESSLPLNQLSQLVMQPLESLQQSVEWMVEKGWVKCSKDQCLTMTEQGIELAQSVQALAVAQESELLKSLSTEQVAHLKSGLKALIG
jgi:flavin reductase (DIM6/NTAB) family NADH-FMN oxidoreductase RutF/DNA-binding MarR family transcriptional regulator